MHLIITGGAGFIGSNFIRFILKKYPNYRLTNIDNLTYAGNLDNLKDVASNRKYHFFKADICDEKKIDKLIKGADCLINFAAQTHVDRSIVSSTEFIRTNIVGTHVLLSLAKKYRIRRFVQISTDEVYGSLKKGHASEDFRLYTSSPYSASKASADLIALSFFKTFNLPVIITRSSNNFGPYQFPEKIMPLFITNIIEGKNVPVYGNGKNIRDWIFVEDNCQAIDLVLHKGKCGEIYNISSGYSIDNLSLAKLILRHMNASLKLIRFVKDRPGHDYRYAINCAKVRRLGFRIRANFLERLRETINWYIENRNWWGPLKKS
ncbi:MAG: dTDP-glucose 4,6-dehydratase [Candidatus Omnitrophota bacterium]